MKREIIVGAIVLFILAALMWDTGYHACKVL